MYLVCVIEKSIPHSLFFRHATYKCCHSNIYHLHPEKQRIRDTYSGKPLILGEKRELIAYPGGGGELSGDLSQVCPHSFMHRYQF